MAARASSTAARAPSVSRGYPPASPVGIPAARGGSWHWYGRITALPPPAWHCRAPGAWRWWARNSPSLSLNTNRASAKSGCSIIHPKSPSRPRPSNLEPTISMSERRVVRVEPDEHPPGGGDRTRGHHDVLGHHAHVAHGPFEGRARRAGGDGGPGVDDLHRPHRLGATVRARQAHHRLLLGRGLAPRARRLPHLVDGLEDEGPSGPQPGLRLGHRQLGLGPLP